MLDKFNLSINGRNFTLPRCQQLLDSKPDMEARGQKAVDILQYAYAYGKFTPGQQRLINGAEKLQRYMESTLPEIMALATLGYTEDEVQTLITKLDNAALPLVQELIDAVDAVLAEASE